MRRVIAAGVLPLVLLSGCREDEIRVYDVVNDAPPASPAGLPAGHPSITSPGRPAPGGDSGMGELPGGMDEAAPRDLAWTIPAGWKEQAGSGMRVATITVAAGGGTAEMSVIALPGTAGGTLANVNRWRGQMGLGEIGEGELGKTSTRVKSPAGEVVVVEFAGAAGKGTLHGGLVSVKGRMWFFKTIGSAAVITAARGPLQEFMRSLRVR